MNVGNVNSTKTKSQLIHRSDVVLTQRNVYQSKQYICLYQTTSLRLVGTSFGHCMIKSLILYILCLQGLLKLRDTHPPPLLWSLVIYPRLKVQISHPPINYNSKILFLNLFLKYIKEVYRKICEKETLVKNYNFAAIIRSDTF